jgi:drug/metabolite transporter (DMT)-like permease
VASWVAYSLVGKQTMKHMSPLVSVTYASLAGTVLLFPPALASGLIGSLPNYSSVDWFSFLYLGIFGTVLGFFWYYQGIARIGPMKASVFINFVPISAIVLSAVILNEPVNLFLIIGAALVILGVTMTNAADLVKRLSRGMKHSMVPSGPS